jgi:hypothetical protein
VSRQVSTSAIGNDVLLAGAPVDEAIDCLNRSKSAARSAEGLQRIFGPKRPSPDRGKTQLFAGDATRKMFGHVSQRDNSLVFSVNHGILSSKRPPQVIT